MKPLSLLLAAIALAAVVLLVLTGREPAAPSRPPGGSLLEPGSPAPEIVEQPRPPDEAPRELPPSLRGTRPLGQLEVDADGAFEPNREALLFFEYFLSASHEEPLTELVGRMETAIVDSLGEAAAQEAKLFLEAYLAYRDAAAEEFTDPRMAEADLEQRLQWIREFRRSFFGAELAEELFAEEEQTLLVDAEMRRIAQDPDLEPEERRQRLMDLRERYPTPVRDARERASAPLRHARAERGLREAGASDDEIQELREESFGPDAASRLRSLDEERAAWEARLARYQDERDAILARGDRPDVLDADLENLRAAHFGPGEIRRIRILDRLDTTRKP